jgi:hypothetical protein
LRLWFVVSVVVFASYHELKVVSSYSCHHVLEHNSFSGCGLSSNHCMNSFCYRVWLVPHISVALH